VFRVSHPEPGKEVVDRDEVADFIRALVLHRSAPLAGCPLTCEDAALLGLHREAGRFLLPESWDPFAPTAIRRALSTRAQNWLTALEVHPVVGSTNTELVARGASETINGRVVLAEVQLHGRGRRGKVWLSPLGGNLALSMGFSAVRPAAELGGLSLVVGLAVIDALEAAGVSELALKWPNDILLDGAKLGGILIELVSGHAENSLVIGIGINLRIGPQVRATLDLPVAELLDAVDTLPSRSELAGRLISSVVEFEAGFSSRGFGPFMEIFDRRHAYHQMEICIIQGEHRRLGRVEGVAADGGLRVATAEGTQIVHGGEVSLRLQER